MKLNVMERLMLINVLPSESNFVNLKIINDLRQAIGFTEAEHKEFDMKTLPDNQVSWDLTKSIDKEYDIGPKATSIIVEALEKMDQRKQLTPNHLSLYEKFIKTEKE